MERVQPSNNTAGLIKKSRKTKERSAADETVPATSGWLCAVSHCQNRQRVYKCLLLTQPQKVKVVISKQINAHSCLWTTGNSIRQSNSMQHLNSQQQYHHQLITDSRVDKHMFKGPSDEYVQENYLITKYEGHAVDIFQTTNNEDHLI